MGAQYKNTRIFIDDEGTRLGSFGEIDFVGSDVVVTDGGNGKAIVTISSGIAAAWLLNGNTVGSEKYIGTIDGFDWPIRTNNVERAVYTSAGQYGFGVAVPLEDFDIRGRSQFLNGTSAADPFSAATAQGGTQYTEYKATEGIGLPVVGNGSLLTFGVIADPIVDLQYFSRTSSIYYDQSIGTTFDTSPIEPPAFVGQLGLVFINSSSVTVEKLSGFESIFANQTAGATVNHAYGYYAAGITAAAANNGTTNNYYGFYQEDQTGHPGLPTNRWGVYVNDPLSNNFFIGKVGIGAGKTTPSSTLEVGGTILVDNYIKFNNALTSTYIGFETYAAITTGTKNTFIGYQAGKSVSTANGNTFVGQQAGLLHDTGENNTYIGDQVAADPSVGARTAQRNTFVGQSSGYSIKTGQNNVFIGKNTGGGSTGVGPAQSSNVFVGSQSGQVNTADNNTFLGFNTGAANSTGTQNTFIGSGVGTSVTTGSGNIFIGYNIAGTAASANQLNIAAYIFGDLSLGKVGFGVSSPGAAVEIKANTTTIASVKLNDGTLLTTPVAGSLEPVTDRLAYTTATGTTRKDVSLLVYRGISALRTLDGSDELVNITSGTFAVTLPTAVGFTGQYKIKNSGTGVTTLNTTSSQTIDGSASGVITLNQYDWVVLRSNGSNWIIVG